METGVFGARVRGIFDGIASGAWPFLKLVVIPRTSEQEHKLFLYLREVARQGFSTGMPDVYLYNLLHARSAEAEQYGLERTDDFVRNLERRSNRTISCARWKNRTRRVGQSGHCWTFARGRTLDWAERRPWP